MKNKTFQNHYLWSGLKLQTSDLLNFTKLEFHHHVVKLDKYSNTTKFNIKNLKVRNRDLTTKKFL